MKNDWFEDWFNTDEYLNVYKHRNETDAEDHIKLILKTVSLNDDAKILDMACGSGRHSIMLARKGYDITAVDLSSNLLSVAKANAAKEKLKINFIQSDIRTFDTPQKFDLIINLFTSFGYFDTDAENFSVLKKAYDYIKKDGYFVLDYFNTNYLTNNLIAYSKEQMGNSEFIQERKIEEQRVVKKISIIKNGITKEFEESVRMYDKNELAKVLINIGFDIYKTFGDFLGSDFNVINSPRVIFICRK